MQGMGSDSPLAGLSCCGAKLKMKHFCRFLL
uniref:Uncharacterized protein n=1 Tax=Arundo donax TaxID=35708 RepID=A0A0A9AB50_ARUDO